MDGTDSKMWGGASGGGDEATRGAWLADSRFAMFIHWGVYSHLGARWKGKTHYGISEWIMHRAQIPVDEDEAVAAEFNPVDFDAREWVRLAKAAGMRHIMITAKHHDGFAMYRSQVSGFNIADATPFKRDPLAELAEACKEEGLRLGFYYSQTADWHEPDGIGNDWSGFPAERDFRGYLKRKAIPQIEELLQGYGPVAGIWFDTPGPITEDESRLLVERVHELQPDCLVNSRIGNGLGDYDALGDQEIPRQPREGLWETPDTHNDTWAFAWYDENWKGPTEVAQRLVRVVSRGGTYMLNVGPDGRGRIPEMSARILREVGEWVTAHEAAIHGAGPTPLGPLPWGECTTRGSTLYLHVFDWPEDGLLVVPGVNSGAVRAELVGWGELRVQEGGECLIVRLPMQRPGGLIPVVALEMSGPVATARELHVLNGCTNVLDAGVAELSECELAEVHWMEKFGDWKHAECVAGWTTPDSVATWSFATLEPGAFYVDVEYTCPVTDDYSEWHLTCDGKAVTFPLIDTGERETRAAFGGELPRFRSYRVGVLDLPEAGAHKLSFGPTGAAGGGVRVASLTLSPVR